MGAMDAAAASPPLQAEPTPDARADVFSTELNANDDGWSAPVNLSGSGVASTPHLVVDAQGNEFVLWREEGVDGMVYARSDGREWSSPQVAEFPFATRAYYPDLVANEAAPIFAPLLVADEANEMIHALWVDENRTLWHSQVSSESFGEFQSWTERSEVAEFTVGVNAVVDTGGTLHVGYMRQEETEEQPAGVYYQQSDDAGGSWSDPALLYPTRYTIALAASDARLQLAARGVGGDANVFVGWEIDPLQKIFLARSLDGGATWDTDVLDERSVDDRPNTMAPSNLLLAFDGNAVFALWQAGHDEAPCTQYYDWSSDGGETWHGRQSMLESFLFCPSQAQLLTYRGADPLLLTVIDGQSYLQAWDGEEWSEPQTQELLAAFVNPQTFGQVNLGCLEARRPQANNIVIVGCEQDETGDVWTMRRTLEDMEAWFAPPPPWRDPVAVFEGTQELKAVQLLPAGANRLHAFWSQTTGEGTVHYAHWDGQRWTRPSPVVSASDRNVGPPSVATGADGRLFLSWHGEDGNIYFSAANSDQALTAADWSVPQTLPLPGNTRAILPDIVAAEDRLLVAYTVPLNEYRGVYLTTSTDRGETWTDPVAVFDGVAAGWQAVGGVATAVSENGVVHALTVDEAIGTDGTIETQALHYTRSEDGGRTFSGRDEVFAGSIPWYRIVVLPGGLIHRLWQEESADESLALWHQVSRDNGKSWELAQRLPVEPGASMVAADGGRAIHLLHATPELLRHWVWDGDRWNSAESFDWHKALAPLSAPDHGLGAATITAEGHLVALYDLPESNGSGESGLAGLIFTEREIERSEPLTTLDPGATATVSPTVTPTATVATGAEEGVMPVNGDDVEANTDASTAEPNPVGQILLAVIPAGLVVIIVGFITMRRARSD